MNYFKKTYGPVLEKNTDGTSIVSVKGTDGKIVHQVDSSGQDLQSPTVLKELKESLLNIIEEEAELVSQNDFLTMIESGPVVEFSRMVEDQSVSVEGGSLYPLKQEEDSTLTTMTDFMRYARAHKLTQLRDDPGVFEKGSRVLVGREGDTVNIVQVKTVDGAQPNDSILKKVVEFAAGQDVNRSRQMSPM